ncbi:MAG: FtsX-like permease family protein [Pseudomonadota bacterium]
MSDTFGRPLTVSLVSQHRYALGAAGKALWLNRWGVLVNCVILGVSLSLPILLISIVLKGASAISIHQNARLVFLDFDVQSKLTQQQEIYDRLKTNPLVIGVSRSDRVSQLKKVLGQLDIEMTPALERLNPFPNTLEIALSARPVDQPAIDLLLKDLSKTSGVLSIFDRTGLGRQSSPLAVNRLSRIFVVLAIVVVVSVALLSGYMVRNQILKKRLEIEVTRYCGAEPNFLQRPFIYWGTIQTIIGTVLALFIAFGAWQLLHRPMGQLSDAAAARSAFSLLSVEQSGAVLAAGCVLGFVSAWVTSKLHISADTEN